MMMAEQVLVIGGTSGMGEATSRVLAEEGFRVILTGRTPEKVQKSVSALHSPAIGGHLLDFTSDDSVRELFSRLETVDHLVLVGSGAPRRGRLEEVTVEDARLGWEEKFLGYLRCVQAALPHWSRTGSLTVVSGGAARAAIPGTSLVAAVNGALQTWALTLAKELAPRRVNVVSPGIIDTPLHGWLEPQVRDARFAAIAASLPVGRMGTPTDVAQAIVSLVQNSFITGAVLDVDGGIRLK
jgi:NAD(P)-dependent dehydrogenase (short-subunit alcohol dehydrogenase family)